MPTTNPDPSLLKVVTLVALPPACLAALATSAFGPFTTLAFDSPADAVKRLTESGCEALILADDGSEAARIAAAGVAPDVAILVVVAKLDPAIVLDWLHRGVQDVLLHADLAAASLPLRLRASIERKRREHDARSAYSTDVETGLPHQQQLIEHMSQLIALRERERAPMALLALRIEGFATTEVRLGREAASVLRRKVAVRLRAG
ncbi:MAG: hypothetical protein M3R60_18145, partial [Pseudomonadota bacterium]|nr:hypothetical protein [Pseudomonadota bacterium]